MYTTLKVTVGRRTHTFRDVTRVLPNNDEFFEVHSADGVTGFPAGKVKKYSGTKQ